MKISNKRELQQILFNHSSCIGFQDFKNLNKNCTAKSYFFLVTDTIPPSDNSLHFRKNLLEKMERLIMTTDDKVKDEKLQYGISRGATKLSKN